jgi:hypothetical protein
MSIRTWLNNVHPNFVTRSNNTGYLKVKYNNGRYVAVGGQINPINGVTYPSSSTNIGGPVTAKLCSWSTDGANWTDSVSGIPALGTTVVYNNLEWNGTYWIACAGRQISDVWSTSKARSTDAVTWTNVNDTGILVNGLVSAPATGRLLYVGARNGLSILDLTWNLDGLDMTTNLLAYTTQAVTSSMTAALNNTVIWMTAGVGNVLTSTGLGAQGSHLASNWTSRTVPWGTQGGAATSQRWAMALASDGIQILALVSDTPMSNPAASQVTPIRIYRTVNNGVTWLGPIMLPYNPSTGQGPYFDIIFNGKLWCVIGYGSCLLSKDGIDWTPVQIPAGLWRSVASDGDSFVAVSQDGYRIKMKFDEAAVGVSASRMAKPEEFFSEIIEELEVPPPAITEEKEAT